MIMCKYECLSGYEHLLILDNQFELYDYDTIILAILDIFDELSLDMEDWTFFSNNRFVSWKRYVSELDEENEEIKRLFKEDEDNEDYDLERHK